MPMQGNTDTQSAKVRFPKVRTDRGLIILTANVKAAACSIITFGPGATANITNGMIAAGVNVGQVGNVTTGVDGFDATGPAVVNVNTTAVFLSTATQGYMTAGQEVKFSDPFVYKPGTLANTYNANTYLVTMTRANNKASLANGHVTHQGWNYVTVGTGFVKSIQITAPGGGMSNGTLTFAANTQYPGGSGAQASYTVNSYGSIVQVNVTANGSGYVVTPNVSAPGNAAFSITMGGRANRIQVECLSAINNAVSLTSTSGGIWFPGS